MAWNIAKGSPRFGDGSLYVTPLEYLHSIYDVITSNFEDVTFILNFRNTSQQNNDYSGGSRISRRGGVDSRGGYILQILYVETKESEPVGEVCAGHAPLDPPMDWSLN